MTSRPSGARWSATGFIAAAILLASAAPVPPGAGPAGIDKPLHALADGSRAPVGVAAAADAIGTAYGLGVEAVQLALPHRGFDFADLAADAVGAIVAVLAQRVTGWA